MDISSLLSPQDSPALETATSPVPSPTQIPKSSGRILKQAIRSTPRSHSYNADRPNAATSTQTLMPSPPTSSLTQQRPSHQVSTSGMDTLADLASMQHHQQTARANASGLRNTELYEARLSSTNIRPSLQEIARTHSGSRSSLDIRMADAPTSTPPSRVFTTPSLSEIDLQLVSQLVAYLAGNGHAYEAHVQLVQVLYRGFLSHIYPNSGSVPENDPSTYDLLGELKQAIEAMASRFSLGEELWMARIQLQQFIAISLEDCMGVVELCEKAVAEERGSTSLWVCYGEWMLSLYTTGNPADQAAQQLSKPLSASIRLTEEDLLAIGEVFSRTQLLDIWKRGTDDTRYRMDSSQLVWNKYTDLLLLDLDTASSKEVVEAFRSHFHDRLEIPHETWDETFQKFSSFISTYDNANYEVVMVSTNRQGARVKAQFSERVDFETSLRRAVDEKDRNTEWTQFSHYLDAETSQNRRKKGYSFDICSAIYQRAILRFPSNTDLWEDYLTLLVDEGADRMNQESSVSMLGRACNHCPWSGTLWAQYIQAAELANLRDPFTDIGEIKHKATSTGLLDFGGMEEVLKIHTAWCGFLRRKAFQQGSSDEELDVAEVGIRSAIEDTETLGKTKYGADYKGDPKYRLDRIYIKFLVQSRNYNGARDTWKSLVARHGNSYEFWIRYYSWEMIMWAAMLNTEDSDAPRQSPTEATRVLSQAVQRSGLDWPEKVIETYLSHCEDHEDAAALQRAVIQCRNATRAADRRREREAAEAAETAEHQQFNAEAGPNDESRSAKRKRGGFEPDEDGCNKKSRPDENAGEMSLDAQEQSPLNQETLKRDRENTTALVKNLPRNTTEKRLRHFFGDCGTINRIKLTIDEGENSAQAAIEFEAKEDVLAAQTKDMKTFDGRAIEVQIGTGTTIFVTNFPPAADDGYIRDKFSKFGDVVDIRFPSLKYDTHRRFCYIEFKSAQQALAATDLDGKIVEGGLKLLAKISDPSRKQKRHGAVHEGREVFISNLDWSATTQELSEIFSKYGNVETVRIPQNLAGKSKGIAFVVYATQDEAKAALELNLTKFKSRLMNVTLATGDLNKRAATTIITRASGSPQPTAPNGAASPLPEQKTPTFEEISSRTVILLYVPDTINDARIRAIAEPYGSLRKITLRPDHQGAVLEYVDVNAAGKASLGLEGYELLPGRKLRIGTMGDLKNLKADYHKDKTQPIKKSKGTKDYKYGEGKMSGEGQSRQFMPSTPVRRPGQQGGRKAGLGFKRERGATELQGKRSEEVNGNGNSGGEGGGASTVTPKSNADFKAMFTDK